MEFLLQVSSKKTWRIKEDLEVLTLRIKEDLESSSQILQIFFGDVGGWGRDPKK